LVKNCIERSSMHEAVASGYLNFSLDVSPDLVNHLHYELAYVELSVAYVCISPQRCTLLWALGH